MIPTMKTIIIMYIHIRISIEQACHLLDTVI